MALIELTNDDLCAALSFPMPCEEGTIIDATAAAHQLGLVETTAAIFEDDAGQPNPGDGVADGDAAFTVARTADQRLVMVSLACSIEASKAVTQARAVSQDAAQSGDRAGIRNTLDAFVDGLIASPPVLTTVLPPAGSVLVIGTVVVTIPTPPPVPPRWEEGEQLARSHLLALAARLQAASKMSGVGATAEDLTGAAARLLDAAIAR